MGSDDVDLDESDDELDVELEDPDDDVLDDSDDDSLEECLAATHWMATARTQQRTAAQRIACGGVTVQPGIRSANMCFQIGCGAV